LSVYIVRRQTLKGPRWHVRCELRNQPVIHLGVYDTERRAKIRREAAKDEIAQGRVPQRFAQAEAPAASKTLSVAGLEWIDTRHDLKDVTRRPYERMVKAWPASIASLEVTMITHADVQAWVMDMTPRLKRGTIARELVVLKLVLDYAGRYIDNPARDRRIRLPRREPNTYRLPTRAQIAQMHEVMPNRVPLMTLLEHTGLRIHEAAQLRWRDIDTTRARLLVVQSKTPAGRRFVEHLPGTPPFPMPGEGDDPAALVFPRARSLTNVLRESHIRYGSFLMSAHEFRHLHASRLLHEGILSPAQISARMGHANPAMTLKTYAHVVPPDD
jgi:integrase